MNLSARAKIGVGLCGLAGLVISWAFFVGWGLQHGLDPVRFCAQALWESEATGLVWDLTACAALLTVVTLHELPRLGGKRVAAILLGNWILGVCVGLALFFLLRAPSEPLPSSA